MTAVSPQATQRSSLAWPFQPLLLDQLLCRRSSPVDGTGCRGKAKGRGRACPRPNLLPLHVAATSCASRLPSKEPLLNIATAIAAWG